MMTWAEKIEAKGYSLGHQEGHQEGHREGRREGHREGRREGFQAGRQEGEAALLLRMAERKFGRVSSAARRQIEEARPEQLLEWGERLVTAQSLEEMLASD